MFLYTLGCVCYFTPLQGEKPTTGKVASQEETIPPLAQLRRKKFLNLFIMFAS